MKKKFYSQVLDPVGRWTGNAFLFEDSLVGQGRTTGVCVLVGGGGVCRVGQCIDTSY